MPTNLKVSVLKPNGFIPGPEGNQRIAELLGKVTCVRENSVYTRVENAGAGEGLWEACPNYCGELAATAEIVELVDSVPYIKKTTTGKFVVMFSYEGVPHLTPEHKKASNALAHVAYFLLLNR